MHEIAIAEKKNVNTLTFYSQLLSLLYLESSSVVGFSSLGLNLLIFIGIPRITQVVMFTSFLKTAYVQNFFLFSYTQRVSNYSIGCVVCL